jgi:hypothetical protein
VYVLWFNFDLLWYEILCVQKMIARFWFLACMLSWC